MAELHLSGNPEADRLLSSDPFALLIGMVLDQQIPLERAFSSPKDLKDRLGGRLDAIEIAAIDPDALSKVFAERPALHRFPAANAKRVQDLARIIIDEYGGDAAAVWNEAKTGEELLKRLRALPGFGEHKARIFVGLLGKQLGVRPNGWREAAGQFGADGTFMSVADIVDANSLTKVRGYKQQMKAAAKAATAGR
ncbi:MAG TPA: HhH-GPD-type base excision DNA repair protein [Acidimicrobiales bacterium]|nr:HhH-GPD-type base excision DNA repair protein [Acidimicrobiales bacterium]